VLVLLLGLFLLVGFCPVIGSASPAWEPFQEAGKGNDGPSKGKKDDIDDQDKQDGKAKSGSDGKDQQDEDDASDDEESSKEKPKLPDPAEPTGREGTEPGDMIPGIEGKDVDGESFELADYEGKVIMLDFWGDW
jgi:hypothetical protein